MSSSQGADAYMKLMANMQFQVLLPGCEEGRGLPPQLPNSIPKFCLQCSWYLLASVVNTDVSTLDGAPLCRGCHRGSTACSECPPTVTPHGPPHTEQENASDRRVLTVLEGMFVFHPP